MSIVEIIFICDTFADNKVKSELFPTVSFCLDNAAFVNLGADYHCYVQQLSSLKIIDGLVYRGFVDPNGTGGGLFRTCRAVI